MEIQLDTKQVYQVSNYCKLNHLQNVVGFKYSYFTTAIKKMKTAIILTQNTWHLCQGNL